MTEASDDMVRIREQGESGPYAVYFEDPDRLSRPLSSLGDRAAWVPRELWDRYVVARDEAEELEIEIAKIMREAN